MTAYNILHNHATPEAIIVHFNHCEPQFIALIVQRIALHEYAKKIVNHAWRTEAWQDNKLIGLVAAYFDDRNNKGFITHVSVLPEFQRSGIGNQLFIRNIQQLKTMGATEISLEVDTSNVSAQRFYLKHGFILRALLHSTISMTYTVRK